MNASPTPEPVLEGPTLGPSTDPAAVKRPAWVRPASRILELAEVDTLADVEVAFTTFCTSPTVDFGDF